MKKYLCLFAFLCTLGFIACEDSEEVKTIDFTLLAPDGNNPTQLRIASDGYTTEFTVRSNALWAVSRPQEARWLTVSPVYGKGDGKVSLSAEANDTKDFREADLTFYANNQKALTLTIKQEPHGIFLVVEPQTAEAPSEGGDITLTLDTNAEKWEYTIPDNASTWLEEVSRDEKSVTLSVGANPQKKPRTAIVEFTAATGTDRIETEVVISQEAGLKDNPLPLLDIVFNEDGTARDASSWKLPVETIPGSALQVYRNESYRRLVARFNHDPGTSISSGYYKVDYSANAAFLNAMADGHSMELLFMYNAEPVNKEIKPFSSMEAGGTGFLLAKEDAGKNRKTSEITFLPNTTDGGWKWTASGIVPQQGVYYHVVGVWDKAAQKSRIYVNGELKAEVDAKGELNPPKDGSKWICIGGDSGPSGGQAAWKGDIVLARIYDEVLTADNVTSLWSEVKDKQPSEIIQITDPLVISGIDVSAGSKYRILGQGFEAGDKVLFSPKSGTQQYTLAGRTTEKYIDVDIPDDFVTGEYNLSLLRNEAATPLGTAVLTMSDTPTRLNMPAIIAHRGYHTVNGAAQNSIASFTAAQKEAYYGSEADFYITKDGIVVSNHDTTIGGKKIEDSVYADIKDEKLSNGETLPTLKDYLDKLKASASKTRLILEIKTHSTDERNKRAVDTIVEQVDKAGLASKVNYIAFSYYVCTQLAGKGLPAGSTIAYLNGDKAPGTLDNGINCIDYAMKPLRDNPSWIQQAHDAGIKVNVWTVNSRQDMLDFIAKGVDYITTDNPHTLQELYDTLSE